MSASPERASNSSSVTLPDFPLGAELEVFVRREDAERFIEEVRGDEPAIAAERELEAGGLNSRVARRQ